MNMPVTTEKLETGTRFRARRKQKEVETATVEQPEKAIKKRPRSKKPINEKDRDKHS